MSFWQGLEQIDIISAYTTRLEHLTSLSDVVPAGSLSVMAGSDKGAEDWFLLEDGWRGFDAPELTLPASNSSVGLGEQFLKWWPQPREITIPFQRRESVSKDALDRHIYSSIPLVLRFSFTSSPSRFFIAAHARSERPVTAVSYTHLTLPTKA